MLSLLPGCSTTQTVDPATLPDQQQVKLYQGEAPGQATWDKNEPIPEMVETGRGGYRFVHEPVLDIYHAKGENRTGTAVVICPGGGYGVLAYEHEGHEIARWLNQNGITGVILRYRMYPYRHPVPMVDVQQAIATVRSYAPQWGVDPQRIGVMGFSAGGHLASTAAVRYNRISVPESGRKDNVSSRPDFAVLVYPVISMQQGVTHGGSRRNLLGPNPDETLVGQMSNEQQVSKNTPPTFLVHSKDDKVVLIKNSELFRAALKKHDVPGELMVFETGGHGYGLGRGRNDENKTHETDAWPSRCIEWLAEQGLLD
jgi:acetyl esterase/lipase